MLRQNYTGAVMLQNLYKDGYHNHQTSVKLGYYHGTRSRKPRKAGLIVNILPCGESKSCSESRIALRIFGWTSVAVGVAAVGLYVGRELRSLYQFRHRTPTDFYAHAGDGSPAEFGMGI